MKIFSGSNFPEQLGKSSPQAYEQTAAKKWAAQAQEELIQAAQDLLQVQEKLSPEQQRAIYKIKKEVEAYAAQITGQPKDCAPLKLFLPPLYCQQILQLALSDGIQTPSLPAAAQNYLQKEEALRNAYLRDAWEDISQVWKSSPPGWQHYYQSRWNEFYSALSDPWKAFAEDVVKNATPQEEKMKKSCEIYLQYERLLQSGVNPFVYPLVLNASKPFPRQSFFYHSFQNSLNQQSALQLEDYYLTPLLSDPMTAEMYRNIKTGMTFLQNMIQGIGSWQSFHFYPSPCI